MIRLSLLLALGMAAPGAWWRSPAAADQPPLTLSGLALTGYTLWSHAPPGWNWAPAPAPAPVAAATSALDGAITITFSLPQAALPGVSPTRVRFGAASGFIANGPVV